MFSEDPGRPTRLDASARSDRTRRSNAAWAFGFGALFVIAAAIDALRHGPVEGYLLLAILAALSMALGVREWRG